MRVCIAPYYSGPDRSDGGIRRVVEAQIKYLPEFGIQTTDDPNGADLIACHGATLVEQPGVPMVAHCHGLMWESYGFGEGGDTVNKRVIDVMTRAQAITAPSRWVAGAISRGMLARPEVIYHGVNADEWQHNDDHLGYVLWNKARTDPVSDPYDMNEVARLLPNIRFVSTFGQPTGNVLTIGAMPYDDMRPAVQRASVYLATARETFGIGTLEAMAAGVPIAGWRYGGQAEIVIEGETGYLAEWGDYQGLAECIRKCLAERSQLSRNCLADVQKRWQWKDKIAQYAALYQDTLTRWTAKRPRVSVVVTCHNLGRYLEDALASIARQTLNDWECLIVDDASTDDTPRVAQSRAKSDDRFRYLKTPHNLKLSGARNYGWRQSKGRYIIFLDADDKLAPNALDTLSMALDRDTSIHICYGHLDTISEDGDNQQRNPWPGSAFNWHAQIAHLNQLPYASMMRREVLERSGGYRARDWRAEDASFWTRVTSFGFRAAKVTEDTLLLYRIRSDSKGMTERQQYADGDGDWTAWYPWRLAGNAEDGLAAMRAHQQPNYAIVPFGAQGTPPVPHKAWPVRHHQHPLISIIVPVGPGHAKYLPDALDSVQAQTLPDWECIVVNDTGETIDLTPWPWVHSWEVNRIENDKVMRMGAGAARNWGLRHATAPLVTFLDADDILVPRALEMMVSAYIESGGQYVYGDCVTLEDETRIDSQPQMHDAGDYDARRMLHQLYHAVTTLVPTEHALNVGGFNEQLPVFEDWDFYCKLAVAGVCGVRVAQPLLIVRQGDGLRTKKAMQPRENDDDAPRYTPLGEQTAAAILDHYARYRSGEEPIMGCCGGSAPVIDQAQSALDHMLGAMGFEMPEQITVDPAMPVRMEFIGDEWGEQTYIGKGSGLQYRAGRDPSARYHDVDPRDVQHFLDLGKFRVVPRPAPERQPEPVAAEPVRRRGRR